MSEATASPHNKQGPRSSGTAQANANAQSAELNTQTSFNDKSDQGEEARVDREVEKYFRDEPEYTVVVDDFRAALDTQLAYYKRRIAFLGDLCHKVCEERDQANKHVHSTGPTSAKATSLADEELQRSISAIQSAVKDGSQKLKELSDILPASVKQGIPVNSFDISNSSIPTVGALEIDGLANYINQFVQSASKLVQLCSKPQIGPSDSQPQVTKQTHPYLGNGRRIKPDTCRQRKKERDFEVDRLERQIELASDIITDLLNQSDFILSNLETGPVEVDEEAEDIIQSSQEEPQYPPERDDKLERYKVLLELQIKADPTDSTGAVRSLRDAIAKREVETGRRGEETTGGKNGATTTGQKPESKRPSNLMRANMEVQKERLRQIGATLHRRPQTPEEGESSSPTALTGTGDVATLHKKYETALIAKDNIIERLMKELLNARSLNVMSIEDNKKMKKDKKDADAKAADLEKRLNDCLARHTITLPPASKSQEGEGGGDNGGDNGGNYGSYDDDGNFWNDDDIDRSWNPPRESPERNTSPQNGQRSTGTQSREFPSQQPPPSDHQLDTSLPPPPWPTPDLKPPNKTPSPRTSRLKTPRPPPPLSTPQAPRKKRRVGERESTFLTMRRESSIFQEWPTDTKRLSRLGF